MQLRKAEAVDWDAVRTLLSQAKLPTDGAREHLAHFIVAEDDHGIAGVIGRETYGNVALLRSVVVSERARGTGLGGDLVRALEQRATAAGVQEIVLLTTTAERWFPRFGYAVIERADVPAALHASAELRGACPASAIVMHKKMV